MLSDCLPFLLLQRPKQTLFKREGTADSHKKHCEIQSFQLPDLVDESFVPENDSKGSGSGTE